MTQSGLVIAEGWGWGDLEVTETQEGKLTKGHKETCRYDRYILILLVEEMVSQIFYICQNLLHCIL